MKSSIILIYSEFLNRRIYLNHYFQVLLVHEASKGTFSRVFDLEVKDLNDEDAETRTSPFESRFPINIGITGHVATTGDVSFII